MDLYDVAVARKLSSGGGGGGGSSDFSTAEVTINGSGSFQLRFALVYTSGVMDGMTDGCVVSVGTYTAILGANGALLTDYTDAITSTTGAIQTVDKGEYLITGDCTITIS